MRSRSTDAEALLAAVCAGDASRVRELLAQRPELAQSRDGSGRSAYVLANLHGHEPIAAQLLATGLELDIVEAVLAEDWPRFEQLARAEPERLHRAHAFGGGPLHAAAIAGLEGCWRLRSAGCAPDGIPAGGRGYTAARMAVDSGKLTWARLGVCDLCSNGADVNAMQRGGDSILHGAVRRRDPALVRLVIRKGADVAACDENGRTPARLAEQIGWSEGVTLLAGHATLPRDCRASRFALDANRQPVRRPDLRDVPITRQSEVTAKSHFDLAAVRAMVAEDARLVFSISTDDELPIEAAAHLGHAEIMRFYLDQGAPMSLPTAVSLGDLAMSRFWLARDPRLVNERGAHDFPLMFFAVFGGGGIEMVE